jgi:Rho termination factor, N-terminal domain
MDWHSLEKMKVTELREMAKEKLGLEGTSGMHKEKLVEALAKSMGIEKPHKVALGADKTQVKQRIRALKAERAKAGTAHDAVKLASTRHEIHRLKRKLRRMARMAG